MRRRALLLALPLLAATPSLHTDLESSTPAADQVVTAPPTEVVLVFTTPVQLALSGVEVRGPAGALLAAGRLEYVAGSGDQTLRLPLEGTLGNGLHQVSWFTAGPDSHTIRGDFAFTVRAPVLAQADTVSTRPDSVPIAPAPPPSEATVEPSPWDPVGVTGRFLFYLSIVLMVGAAAFRWAVVAPAARRGEEALAEAARRGLTRMGWVAVGAGAVSALVRLVAQSGTSQAGIAAFLFRSPWGWGWWLHVGALLLFAVGLQLSRRSEKGRGGWSLASFALLPLVAAPVLSGHTWATTGALRPIALAADAVHVLAAGAWMGSLAALAMVALPLLHRARDADGRVAVLPGWVDAFSRLALTAVLLLIASGVFNTWTRLGGFGNLTTTAYGRTLLIKLGVLAGALALGFYNWRVVRPSLRETPRTRLLRIPASLEFLIGLGVLLVTAALVVTHLP